MRQQAPRAGRSQDVKQALDNSPQIRFARPPQPLYRRHKRLDHGLFGIRHVACVTQTVPSILFASGFSPHLVFPRAS
jgi:hypothetical protein